MEQSELLEKFLYGKELVAVQEGLVDVGTESGCKEFGGTRRTV